MSGLLRQHIDRRCPGYRQTLAHPGACFSYPPVWRDFYILHRGLYFQPRLGTARVVEERDHVPAIPVHRC